VEETKSVRITPEEAVPPDKVTGRFVFLGSGHAVVKAFGRRYTFKVDTRGMDPQCEVTLSEFWTNRAGYRRPARLTVGRRTWVFDRNGALKHVDEEPQS